MRKDRLLLMKMNEIIRKRRKELNLTQEQIADYLGISTPAVNKWEKGNTYPDITLLPGLARLLKIDMNTLMSFNEDLTDIEIKQIVLEIEKIIKTESYKSGFQLALTYIRDFPTCEALIYSVVLSLSTYLAMLPNEEQEAYLDKIESLYSRICESKDYEIRNKALEFLFMRHCARREYEQAENIIEQLSLDKKVPMANLYMEQGNSKAAKILFESRLFEDITELQNILHGMVKIALSDNKIEEAITLASIIEETAILFRVMPYIAYTAQLECAVYQQDPKMTVLFLSKLLEETDKKWEVSSSILYDSLDLSSANVDAFTSQLLPALVKEFETSTEFEFLKGNTAFNDLLAQYKDRTITYD